MNRIKGDGNIFSVQFSELMIRFLIGAVQHVVARWQHRSTYLYELTITITVTLPFVPLSVKLTVFYIICKHKLGKFSYA